MKGENANIVNEHLQVPDRPISPFLSLFPALHYKHRIVFFSALAACFSYVFQPFGERTTYIWQYFRYLFSAIKGSAICQIRQTPQTYSKYNPYSFTPFVVHHRILDQDVVSTEKIGLADGIDNLDGFLAAAGYVQAAAIHGWGDPPFVFNNWTTAEFVVSV
jgi:hypothetical protein